MARVKLQPRDVCFEVIPQPKGVDLLRALVSWRCGLYAATAVAHGRPISPEDVAWDEAEFERWLEALLRDRRLNPYLDKIARGLKAGCESANPGAWLDDAWLDGDEATPECL
jgi:hypothetical protein